MKLNIIQVCFDKMNRSIINTAQYDEGKNILIEVLHKNAGVTKIEALEWLKANTDIPFDNYKL